MWFRLSNYLLIWVRRLALYFSIYTVIIGSHLYFSKFDWLHTNADSARYMLSALIQSEAAIFALVVTLSLIAVQLAASSYSTKLVQFFKKSPDLWILLLIYGVAIFYGLGVLKYIEEVNPQVCASTFVCQSNLQNQISLAYYFGIFTFVALVPYLWNTFDLLKPSTIIKYLGEEITIKNILSIKKHGLEMYIGNNPIQPIIDILRGSLMKSDFETVKEGLRVIQLRICIILRNETLTEEEANNISHHIFPIMNQFGELIISKEDINSYHEILLLLNNVCISFSKEFEIAIKDGVETIGSLGLSMEKKFDGLTGASEMLAMIGLGNAQQRLEEPTKMAALFLGFIGKEKVEQEFEFAVKSVTKYLGHIGRTTVNQELKDSTLEVARSLKLIGKAAIEHGQNKTAGEIAKTLEELLDLALEHKLINTSQKSEYSLLNPIVGYA